MFHSIKIAAFWLFWLKLLTKYDDLVAFQIHPTPVRPHRRHPMIQSNHQWIRYRYISQELFREDDCDDEEICIIGGRDMKDSNIHNFIGHQPLPVTRIKSSSYLSSISSDRRKILQQLSKAAILSVSTSAIISSPICNYSVVANAATLTASKTNTPAINAKQRQSSTIGNNNKNNMSYISADIAKVTHTVFFNVRISRPDGTFYVRDEDETMIEPENRVYYGQLIFGLFGNNAPIHVQRFLEYITDPNTAATSLTTTSVTLNNDEAPYPSYSRSSFTQFDDATGVLYGGNIPSLEVVEIQQSVALRYGNRLLPAKLWVEDPSIVNNYNKISHDRVGLLTHALLDATPVFGITTRNDTTSLNPTHTVFGALMMNSDAKDFLHRISSIPTYAIDRPIVPPQSTLSSSSSSSSLQSTPSQVMIENGMDTSSASSIIIEQSTMMPTMRPATDAIFNIQRDFFRNTAKTFGDTRINKLYNGKLLRRVEVTQVGLL